MLKINELTYDEDNNKNIPTDYFKDLIFKVKPNIYYKGHGNLPIFHDGIDGLTNAIRLPKTYYYQHAKSRADWLLHYAESMFIVGGGPNLGNENPTWITLRTITDTLELKTWYEFNAYLKKGNIKEILYTFLMDHKDDNLKDGDQNMRALWEYYFELLHPEENIYKIKNLDFKA